MSKTPTSPHLQDQRLAPDIALANDLDKASQLVVEIKQKALDVEHLLQEDIWTSQNSSRKASVYSGEFTPPRSPRKKFGLSPSVSYAPMSVEEKQILSDKIHQLEDDLRVEKLKNKSLCSTYTTDVAELMSQVSNLKMSSAVNNTQTFLNHKLPGASSSIMNASVPGLQDLGKSVGDRLLLSGYFRDDLPNMALSIDNSAIDSSLANSTIIPPLGTTLTASRVNPGFMGRLGPEYPDSYEHRYATISAPDLDGNVPKINKQTVNPVAVTTNPDLNTSIPDPADDPASLCIPATPGPKNFLSVLAFHPAVISNHKRILNMMAHSKLGAMAELNAVTASMTENPALTSTYTGMDMDLKIQTPTGTVEGHDYALTPMTEFINRQQSPSTLAHLTEKSTNKHHEHYERQLKSPGPRRPNYQVRVDAMDSTLKTPVLGQDLVNPALIQHLEFVRLYLSNQFGRTEDVKSLYNSIISMPEFQSAVQIMTESCVEEALTATRLLEAKSIETEILKSRVIELETTLAHTLKDHLISTKEMNHLKSSNGDYETTTNQMNNHVGSSITTISQLGLVQEGPSTINTDKMIAEYESTIDSLTQMVNYSAAEALRISVDETEQRREKEAYKARLETLTSSFEKITQSNYELQQQLDTLTAQSKAIEDSQKRVRISQLHDEIQAYKKENSELKAQMDRIKEAVKAYQNENTCGDIPAELMIQTLTDCIAEKSVELRQVRQDNKKLIEENTRLMAEIDSLHMQIQELQNQQNGVTKSFNDMRLLYIEENKILKEENTLLEEEKRLSEYKNGLLQKKLKTLSDINECEYARGNIGEPGPLQQTALQ